VSASPRSSLSGTRKAAVLLALLGDDVSTEICKHLGKDELRLLAQEISELDDISPEMAAEVLQEYHSLTASPASVGKGGPDYAARLVVKTLGDEGSRPLVQNVIRARENTTQNLEALEKADPKQLAKFLLEEHPQTIALILAHLRPNVAKAVLMVLPEDVRAQSIKRLAQMHNFSPEIVNRISGVLCRKLQSLGEQDRRAYGGVKAVADLLNRLDGKVTTSILETIEKDSDSLALSIRNQMFTFEDFAEVPEAGLRELLSHVDKKTLATSLKSASDKLRDRIFGCMSSRAVEMMKEDMEALGPLRAKDIAQAQTEIIAAARKLESEGKMTLKNTEGEEAYVV
jgi:flagellar motor switch protein FliG